MARLKNYLKLNDILKEVLKITNDMAIPKLEKITINMGLEKLLKKKEK